ncbi:MAG: aldo/keto reductase [Candidatus Dadabacteria bacterium CSP1-2]|nr:MAG: aldo/keto reductase [Candidatus Dadabacteria bacterium CSP1-2]
MELKNLGNTGTMVPEIGLGTWNYSGGVEPLRKGVELGAYFIDTAEGYYTEDVVGKAIKGIRDMVFVATKVSGRHLGYDDVLRAAEGSLRLLNTDYIDLYQIHWPNSRFPLKETMRAMEKLVDSGAVRYIGVSNFSTEELREAQSFIKNYPIVSNQVLYNLNNREIERDLLPYWQKHKVTIIAYTPLDNGSLTKNIGFISSHKMKVLEQIANGVQKTIAQVALNWCTSRPNVIAIPKSNSLARTIENCDASGWRLSQDHIRLLDEAFS